MTDPVDTPAWHGQAYSIKRHGVTLTNCDSEPVQTPGCIQGHGALLVVRRSDGIILQVSENCATWFGAAPDAMLGKPIALALGDSGHARLCAVLDAEPTDNNPSYLCTLPARGDVPALDVSVHVSVGAVILELEPAGVAEGVERREYALLRQAVSRLQSTSTLREFNDAVASEVRRMTGLDRVMIYKFHADGHGEVVAESRRDDLSPFLGLHYPAEDIPRPAREVFKQLWIRPVPDVDGELAELVPLANPDTGAPLTMTHCILRGPSIMYTEYLRNMGVRASITMPIRRDGELWGLIACHHHRPAYLPYPVRAACELFAQVVSLQHASAEEREHLGYRLKLEGVHHQLAAAATQEGGLGAMMKASPSLLDGLDAGGVALFHGERWWRQGNTPDDRQLDALRTWLAARPELASPTEPIYATDSLARYFPEGAEMAAVASGVLAVPLSRINMNLILWFRPETMQTVCWAGDPTDKPTVVGPHGPRLTPRRSFELFAESVRGRSLPWKAVELNAALRLRSLVIELVVSRAEHLAELNADLVVSNEELDAFAYVASHDLKEPLRGIHRYAHHLLDAGAFADEESRKRVEALMRLTVRMDTLIDSLLHYSRVGRSALEYERVDLSEVVDEALEMVAARREDRAVTIRIPRRLPTIACDRVRVREVFVNLLSNALKYANESQRTIEIGYATPDEHLSNAGRPEDVNGHTVFFVRDNGIGIDQKHFVHIFKMFKRLHARDAFGGGTGAGLTIVKKLVERHRGHVWLESTLGEGSTFYFSLPDKDGN
jgi:two-component system, chemotaxis family, sensor kinase Cph1